MAKKRPDPHDIEVGRRIRARRLSRRLSQTALGERLGITFQQVQKYEKGINRIGAGRLRRIAEFLDAPITYFFSVPNQAASNTGDILGYVDDARTLRLVRAYSRIKNPLLQRSLLNLTEQMAAGS